MCGTSKLCVQTLMPHKMVITRSKGIAPPEDVLTLNDAALGLDEKRGHITVGVAGKTSVWKGLSTEDTYKWHDAMLSALAECDSPFATQTNSSDTHRAS